MNRKTTNFAKKLDEASENEKTQSEEGSSTKKETFVNKESSSDDENSVDEESSTNTETESDSDCSSDFSTSTELLISGDKDNKNRLGVSLNIKHFLGNRIHNELSSYQNQYREKFYEINKGKRNGSPFFEQYIEEKQTILSKQDEAIEKNKTEKKTPEEKRKQLEDIIGEVFITRMDNEFAYPNFAVAILSYVQNNESYSKYISIPRMSNTYEGHSEKQIFKKAKKIIKKLMSKSSSIERFILDINSALSMCETKTSNTPIPCYDIATGFIEEIKMKKKITVRVSYNFKHHKDVIKQGDGKNLFQRQVQLPNSNSITNKSFKINSIILSSGYRSYKKHKESVKKTDEFFFMQKLEAHFGKKINIDNVSNDDTSFFHAVAYHLTLSDINPKITEEITEELTSLAVQYVEQHKEDFKGIEKFEDTEKYIKAMAQKRNFYISDQNRPIIQELSTELNLSIVIINDNHVDRPYVIKPEATSSENNATNIYLGHLGESHYVNLIDDNSGVLTQLLH
ncbi:hypothetical protein ABEB36_011838 [Hypothenemus hampei]|uniref:OTU domain-containing protein n=1 Tax=Hypothenemus hampei TaxID=57062 RepID=A0ABD1E9D0_HYPHA